ncbi:hypothetical protein ACWDEW_48830, partial [Streptomyces sp. NPDC001100]
PKKSGPPKSGTSSAKTDKAAKGGDNAGQGKKSAADKNTGKNTSTGRTTGTSKDTGKSTGVDKGKTKATTPPSGTTATTSATPPAAPPSPYVDPTGNAVQTPGDGNCLLYAVIGSAPQLVRTRLQQAAATGTTQALAPATAAWLARPDDVQQALRTMAQNPQAGDRGSNQLRAARQELRNLVLARLAAARDGSRPLPPQVLGQLRGVLVTPFTAAVQNMTAAQIDNELVRYGIQGVTHAEDLDPVDLQTRYLQAVSVQGAPPAPTGAAPSNRRMFAYLRAVNGLPTLATMTTDERRSLLIAGYHRSTAALSDDEANMLGGAVSRWSDAWANPIGDAFLPLLADTLDAPIHVFQP